MSCACEGAAVMPEDRSKSANPFRLLWVFVKRQIVDDAGDLAICEFDCRQTQCMQDEWDTCDRRIRKGAGELFPNSPSEKP
jgi:hypothetical protein